MRTRHWFDILAAALLLATGSLLTPGGPMLHFRQASIVWGSVTGHAQSPSTPRRRG